MALDYKTNQGVRIIPLGGVGEVGRNCNVFEYRSRIIVIDCGVLFPEESQPGIDLILPDLSYLEENIDRVDAIILTHGHEDHIGAVPYLLRLRPDIPVIGSQLTLGFVRPKLDEHGIDANYRVVHDDSELSIGPFDLEFIAVNHSVPDALAVFIRTHEGNIFVTGDFKIDQIPIDGRLTDLRSFARVGEEGVDLFMCDSTNATVPGFVRSESEIGPVLEQDFQESVGQIVVASFSSHVHRVQQVLNAAHVTGKKVAFVGRSMIRNMRIANELGFLDIPDDVLVDMQNMNDLPVHQRVYMSTGSQGEPMAVMSRLAQENHARIKIGKGDTVIFASSLIPGNEKSVYRVMNGLIKLGVRVVHQGNAGVHVSGHAAQGELLYTYNILQPAYAMPIHGEIRHQVANASIAMKTGVEADNVIIAENGSVVEMRDGRSEIIGTLPFTNIYVDGSSVGDITDSELKDRRILSSEGFIAIFAVVNAQAHTIVHGPQIQSRALAEEDDVFESILPDVTSALQRALDNDEDTYGMEQAMRRVIGRWASRTLRRSPMIIPTVAIVD